jgi:hypothetical protein
MMTLTLREILFKVLDALDTLAVPYMITGSLWKRGNRI